MPSIIRTVTSNLFTVKDFAEFSRWIQNDVEWADYSEVGENDGRAWDRGWGSFGQDFPCIPLSSDEIEGSAETDEDDDYEPPEPDPWDIQDFAEQLRQRLTELQQVWFVSSYADAAGMSYQVLLIIPVSGPAVLFELEPEHNDMVAHLQQQLKLLAPCT